METNKIITQTIFNSNIKRRISDVLNDKTLDRVVAIQLLLLQLTTIAGYEIERKYKCHISNITKMLKKEI